MTRRTLVAGVGNIFLGDDGFGVEIVRELSEVALPEGTHVVDFGIRGVHLAYEMLNGYDLVLIIDAVARRSEPGTLYMIDAGNGDLPAEEAILDSHAMTPDAVLGLCRKLGGDARSVVVLGCEPEDCSERIGLSDPVRAAVPEAVALVGDVLREPLAYPAF